MVRRMRTHFGILFFLLLLATMNCNSPSEMGADAAVFPADMATSDPADLASPVDMAGPADMPPPSSALCGSSEWCWEYPKPQGNWLSAVFSLSPTATWMVGESGTVLFYDGRSFALGKTGTDRDLKAVWASATDDVWAVGFNLILHYDGTTWQSLKVAGRDNLGGLTAVFGFAKNNVYIAASGEMFHFDGVAVTPTAMSLRTTHLWGSAPDNLWATDSLGWVGRYDGTGWKLMNTGISGCCRGVYGSSKDDVFFGADSKVVHYDGSKFTSEPVGATVYNLWGSGRDDIWLVGGSGVTYHYNGTAWQKVATGAEEFLYGISGTDRTHAWAVGAEGMILRWDGTQWTALREGAHNESQALWVAGPKDAWAGGFGGLAHYDGTRWTLLPGTQGSIHGIWGSAPDDVWAVGAAVYHWDGKTLSRDTLRPADPLRAVSGTARDDVWAVGQGSQIYHYDGAKWDRVTSPVSTWLLAVWAAARNDVWVAGDYGVVLHGDGTRFVQAPSTGSATSGRAFLGLRRDRAYLATSSGLFKYSGAGWDLVSGVPLNNQYSLSGTADDDLWLGDETRLMHFDGSKWAASLVHSNRFYALKSIDRTRALLGSTRGILRRGMP